MVALSFLALGKNLMQIHKYRSAIDTFTIIINKYANNLRPDYPRFPSYMDNNRQNIQRICDDAQYYIGECYLKLGDYQRALNELAKIDRFFPFSEKRQNANNLIKSILDKTK